MGTSTQKIFFCVQFEIKKRKIPIITNKDRVFWLITGRWRGYPHSESYYYGGGGGGGCSLGEIFIVPRYKYILFQFFFVIILHFVATGIFLPPLFLSNNIRCMID